MTQKEKRKYWWRGPLGYKVGKLRVLHRGGIYVQGTMIGTVENIVLKPVISYTN